MEKDIEKTSQSWGIISQTTNGNGNSTPKWAAAQSLKWKAQPGPRLSFLSSVRRRGRLDLRVVLWERVQRGWKMAETCPGT